MSKATVGSSTPDRVGRTWSQCRCLPGKEERTQAKGTTQAEVRQGTAQGRELGGLAEVTLFQRKWGAVGSRVSGVDL